MNKASCLSLISNALLAYKYAAGGADHRRGEGGRPGLLGRGHRPRTPLLYRHVLVNGMQRPAITLELAEAATVTSGPLRDFLEEIELTD